MLELTIGGKDIWEFCSMIDDLFGFFPCGYLEFSFATLESIYVKYLRICSIRFHRPLLAIVTQLIPYNTGKEGNYFGNFFQ